MKMRLLALWLVALLLTGCVMGQSQLQTEGLTQPAPEQVEPTVQTQPVQSQPTAQITQEDILRDAYGLASGESLEGSHTLTGVITSIPTAYNEKYGNITVIITLPGQESYPVQCYRLEGEGAASLQVGDTVTVTGELVNYKGTVEFSAGCTLDGVTPGQESAQEPEQTQPQQPDDSMEYVAWYIHEYGCLPDFYVTKNEASRLYGWSGGALDSIAPGMCIGGDRFGNYEGQLPNAPGRRWTECDIDTIGRSQRGSKRIVFSNDGLVYYTFDHYNSFTLLYGEP